MELVEIISVKNNARGVLSMPLTILVVDDDLGTRLSISDYLELSGYSVITANDGQEALTMVEAYHPDLIVTDIVMPRMNGYELVRRVRQQPPFRLLPVILLTARTRTQERILGYQSGCDLYLPKPFELEELAAAIRNLLERSQIIQSEYRFSQKDNLGSPLPSKIVESHHSVFTHVEKSHLLSSLTPREQEVLEMLTHGLSNIEIGHQLHLSPRTVEKYVSSLLRKTTTSNRAELVRFAITHGLVE
ncbi:two-component response regulator [Trichormus variabilis NIES-23]|uniref:Two-component response regulator n=2 Tax=Nostocaceae TaxID=1162 RepID=A0A1Z4KNV6_ANAVA|nr:two-component response regulator [Nostoc sp. PCC 7120 = FACHB-418]BAY70671.1 two-component response regulator [Trichormus variabilis NIES-23]